MIQVLSHEARVKQQGQKLDAGPEPTTVAISGRNVIQIICKNEKKKFATMK